MMARHCKWPSPTIATVRPQNLINYAIDIPSILGRSSAYVGFTAGTGEGSENHYVMNFKPGKL
jgi:hypothetical protein